MTIARSTLDWTCIETTINLDVKRCNMLPLEFIPYRLIGFITFWLLTAAVSLVSIITLYYAWLGLVRRVIDWLWRGKNPSKGDMPDGWKAPAAFYMDVILKVSTFKSPMCWRWKTYKQEYQS